MTLTYGGKEDFQITHKGHALHIGNIQRKLGIPISTHCAPADLAQAQSIRGALLVPTVLLHIHIRHILHQQVGWGLTMDIRFEDVLHSLAARQGWWSEGAAESRQAHLIGQQCSPFSSRALTVMEATA